MNIISEVLSAYMSSAKADPIRLVEEHGREHMLPAQVNVMLLIPSGGSKSTMFSKYIGKDIVNVLDYTLPGMIGTIDDKGEIIPGYIMKAAGKPLWIDEFHSLSRKARKSILSITENQWAVRTLGRCVRRPVKLKRKYLRASTCENEVRIDYVRTSIMLSGIFAPHKHPDANVDDCAFSSRFLPVSLNLTWDDIDDMDCGKRFFRVKVDEYRESPVFEDWLKFVKCYREVVNNLPENLKVFLRGKNEFYRRGRLHFAKVFSWASRGNSVVDDWEKFIPFIPFFIYNYVASTLTHSEFEIYTQYRNGLTQSEIARKLSVSEPFVSAKLKKIRGVGIG